MPKPVITYGGMAGRLVLIFVAWSCNVWVFHEAEQIFGVHSLEKKGCRRQRVREVPPCRQRVRKVPPCQHLPWKSKPWVVVCWHLKWHQATQSKNWRQCFWTKRKIAMKTANISISKLQLLADNTLLSDDDQTLESLGLHGESDVMVVYSRMVGWQAGYPNEELLVAVRAGGSSRRSQRWTGLWGPRAVVQPSWLLLQERWRHSSRRFLSTTERPLWGASLWPQLGLGLPFFRMNLSRFGDNFFSMKVLVFLALSIENWFF